MLTMEMLLATSSIRRIKVAALINREQLKRAFAGIPAAIESQEASKGVKG